MFGRCWACRVGARRPPSGTRPCRTVHTPPSQARTQHARRSVRTGLAARAAARQQQCRARPRHSHKLQLRMQWATAAAAGGTVGTNIKDWVSQARVRNWRWCAKVLRSTDDRWTYSAPKWDPACEKKGGRSQGRPATRWEDDSQNFIQTYYGAEHLSLEAWSSTALDAPTWQLLEKDYTTHVL